VVGVNGVGKTTTIGKLAHTLRTQGKTVLLAAADTFRAAAIEQLEIWGERTGTEVIKTKPGGDPSAVLFDALQAAKARHADYVIVDTAGRLHNKQNLMAELEKMCRTAQRIVPGAPHETLLIMDATNRSERIAAGQGLHRSRRRHRHCPHQTGRNRQRRSGSRNLTRNESSRALCWRGRKTIGPHSIQRGRLCRFALRLAMAISADELFLRQVLELAVRGQGLASPIRWLARSLLMNAGVSLAAARIFSQS